MKITMRQSHTLMSTFGTNADWDYLEERYSLNNISEKIERNLEIVGDLFTKFVLNEAIEKKEQKNKEKIFLNEKVIKLSNKILRLIAEHTGWSEINFKSNQTQERIIRNPVGAGKAFTNFLVRIMTDEELGLV